MLVWLWISYIKLVEKVIRIEGLEEWILGYRARLFMDFLRRLGNAWSYRYILISGSRSTISDTVYWNKRAYIVLSRLEFEYKIYLYVYLGGRNRWQWKLRHLHHHLPPVSASDPVGRVHGNVNKCYAKERIFNERQSVKHCPDCQQQQLWAFMCWQL